MKTNRRDFYPVNLVLGGIVDFKPTDNVKPVATIGPGRKYFLKGKSSASWTVTLAQ